ncbi:response regulator [Anaerolineales bacterium]
MARILVIEDDELILKQVAYILQKAGHQTFIANDGDEGLHIAMDQIPDLIVTDIMMPRMDGYRIIKALRSHPETCHIPIIFLTALSSREVSERMKAMGANDFITKPFKQEDLMKSVASRLAQHQQSQQFKQAIIGAKQDFGAVVAQELRTPLVSIQSIQDLITMRQGRVKPEELIKFMAMIQQSTSRITHLVRQTELYMDLENDAQMTEDWQYQDLESILERMLEDLQSPQRDLDRIHIDENNEKHKLFWCNPGLLSYAIMELVSNALKFSNEDQEVYLRYVFTDESVYLEIVDKGVGIPIRHLEAAFTPFQRIEHGLPEQQGIGLGLNLAHRIIQLHHGKIIVDSEQGKGSCVKVYISRLPQGFIPELNYAKT